MEIIVAKKDRAEYETLNYDARSEILVCTQPNGNTLTINGFKKEHASQIKKADLRNRVNLLKQIIVSHGYKFIIQKKKRKAKQPS